MSLLGHVPRVTWEFVMYRGSRNTTERLSGTARDTGSLSSVTIVVGRRWLPADAVGRRGPRPGTTGTGRGPRPESISGGSRTALAAWRPGPRRRVLRAHPRGTAGPAPAPAHR